MNPIVHFDAKDNLATTLRPLSAGEKVIVEGHEIAVNENIPQYHKIALTLIRVGEPVIKYGEVIGRAAKDSEEGTNAHVHNIESLRGRGDK